MATLKEPGAANFARTSVPTFWTPIRSKREISTISKKNLSTNIDLNKIPFGSAILKVD